MTPESRPRPQSGSAWRLPTATACGFSSSSTHSLIFPASRQDGCRRRTRRLCVADVPHYEGCPLHDFGRHRGRCVRHCSRNSACDLGCDRPCSPTGSDHQRWSLLGSAGDGGHHRFRRDRHTDSRRPQGVQCVSLPRRHPGSSARSGGDCRAAHRTSPCQSGLGEGRGIVSRCHRTRRVCSKTGKGHFRPSFSVPFCRERSARHASRSFRTGRPCRRLFILSKKMACHWGVGRHGTLRFR